MSQQQLPPSLERYPGYFPSAKPPFWTRAKVGTATGIVGLLIGLAAGPGSADSGTAATKPTPAPSVSAADIQAKVDDAVAQAEDQMSDKLSTLRDSAQRRLSDVREQSAVAQRRAVTQAVAKAHAQDHAKLVAAVAAAKAAALASAPAASSSSSGSTASSSGSSGGTDPRFSYCYEANDAGYGPYFQGQDPEYYWYDDADGDGEVCE